MYFSLTASCVALRLEPTKIWFTGASVLTCHSLRRLLRSAFFDEMLRVEMVIQQALPPRPVKERRVTYQASTYSVASPIASGSSECVCAIVTLLRNYRFY